MMLAAFTAALMSCQTKEKKENQSVQTCTETTYEGILPAADCPGAAYTLTLKEDSCAGKSDFDLTITYMDAENENERTKVSAKGKMEIINKENKTFYKLPATEGEEVFYFLVVNDSTLRLTNENLEEAASGLNYDIVRVK